VSRSISKPSMLSSARGTEPLRPGWRERNGLIDFTKVQRSIVIHSRLFAGGVGLSATARVVALRPPTLRDQRPLPGKSTALPYDNMEGAFETFKPK
jgi:hypothetical protein